MGAGYPSAVWTASGGCQGRSPVSWMGTTGVPGRVTSALPFPETTNPERMLLRRQACLVPLPVGSEYPQPPLGDPQGSPDSQHPHT